ncbi:aminopeptidase [Paracoccus liaowanqingii]|uniref:Aminopeptidase n=1 Tax=Paracoccus liaowanqingii TaxID=2560053 RepID=A0A4Z1CKY9_9RHOB|nr:M1 family aminopeptidase [Paracoccus liaowanqingii]TGN55826.1 aminopeptidase [Paracoccus liaowanqingii]
MLRTIFLFELRHQFRSPVFWSAGGLFFLLTFAATTVESIRLGSGGTIHTNAPTAVAQIQLIMSLFFMVVTTAFVGNVVVRDDDSGFGAIIRSTRVGKLPYMLGRFSGAFIGAAIAFLAVPLAVWIGTFMPWVDPDNLGPNRIIDYAFGYYAIALPNLLITSAIFFAVACWTRSVTYSYLSVILFMFVYVTLTAMLATWPELSLASLFEPFGTVAFGLSVRYLTPVQSNTHALELTGILLGNRLLWLAISTAIVAASVWRFQFAEPGATARSTRRHAAREQKLAAVRPVILDRLPATAPLRAAWHQLWATTRFETRLIFKSPAFWVLAIVGAMNLIITLNLAGRFYGIPIWPRTFAIIDTVRAASSIITLLMAIYFAGEAVWRERERRFNEIVDATPVPNWTFLLGKLAGIAGALVVLCVGIVLLEAVVFQLVGGVTDIEPRRWLFWFVVPGTLYVIQLAVLSVVVQAISLNKFVGWLIMLLYLVAGIVFSSLGFDHPLLNYAEVPLPLSDMNGAAYGGATAWWLRLYWTAFALLLIVIGHLMWRRGTAVTVRRQLQTLPVRLRGTSMVYLIGALLLTGGLGSYLFYNMNVLNDYTQSSETDGQLARYEHLYSRYVDLPQPTLTDVKLKVDLYPARAAMNVDGVYRFVNATEEAIPTLHLRTMPGFDLALEAVDMAGARLVHEDKDHHYRIYRFDRPLEPGASGTLSFRVAIEKRGLAALPKDPQAYETDAQPAANGAYVVNYQILPLLGMDRTGFLQGKNLRHEHALGPDLPTPKLDDKAAQARNYAGLDRVDTDITVTTDADQTLVATGERVSESVSNGRRSARFVSPMPSLNFISIQSARYDVRSVDADGVDLQVYYHPAHGKNVDRMLGAMRSSLNYYRSNFGPYQYPYARIVERPGYGGGANSAAGTIGYSEKVGFIMDLSDPGRLDFVSYLTAHELAHQYWFHQLMPADMEGAELLTEGLAQYSALMVMKQRYGNEQVRTFLKYELDRYLQGRRAEAEEEKPLAYTRNQGYIHYNKASIVMYLLQDRLGEARVNAMLRDLIDRYRFRAAPYARSSDLLAGFLALARTDAERELILDQFHRITLYDLKASQATVHRLANGQFETTVTIDALKTYANGMGDEKEAPFDEQVDVGVFTARPGDKGFSRENVVSIRRAPIRSGTQQIRIVSQRKPLYAGVDPYVHFIDRSPNDNIVHISETAR